MIASLVFRSLQKAQEKPYAKSSVGGRENVEPKPEPEPEGWVSAEELDDLTGPLVLIVNEEKPHVVTFSENGKIIAEACNDAESFEPENVTQVLVGKVILPGFFSLKTAFNRYLSCDSVGNVFATREAIGPTENWKPVLGENGRIAFQNAFHSFLSVSPGSFTVRADADDIGPNELFTVKCQALERYQRKLAAQPKNVVVHQVSPKELEDEEFKKYHAYARKPATISSKDSRDLEEAMKEGRLRETLLDRRVKAKHDKFC